MWTINYKGFYIHGYTYKDEVSVSTLGSFKSLHAAKIKITKLGA